MVCILKWTSAELSITLFFAHRSLTVLKFYSIWELIKLCGHSSQVKSIPDTFTSLCTYLNSFICPLIEEVHADVFSSLDGYAQASFIQIIWVEKLDDEKSIYCFEVSEPSKDQKSRQTYDPKEGDIIVVSLRKPQHVSDLIQSKALYVLGSVLKCEDKEDGDFPPNFCIVRFSSVIPVEVDPETKIPMRPSFAVFLINMKTYTRIWKCLHMGTKDQSVVNLVCQYKPRVCQLFTCKNN
jgi:senataxin